MFSRTLSWSIVAAFALVALAVIGSAWSTRRTVLSAADEVRGGQTLAAQQAVRADLSDLDGPPTAADLNTILRERDGDGVRYLAIVDRRDGTIAAAGTAVGGAPTLDERDPSRRGQQIVGGRVRVELRVTGRRTWGSGGRPFSIIMEVEPVAADEMRAAARRTVDIGALAALILLGVAITVVLRELRRRADEQQREREKRLASLGEMSAVLAHEIKNPLASLKGNAQLLAAMLPAGDGSDPMQAKARTKAQRVVDEALRLEQLTIDLLAFVRTGAIARTPADPAALVRDAAASVSPDIVVELAGAPPSWSFDAARMRQVIVNLLDNANAAGPPARAAVRVDAGRLIIDIADRGPGVAVADRDKIFEPFHTGKTHGTGLGLAVARRIVEQHGGTISVGDAPGGGALFRVILPA